MKKHFYLLSALIMGLSMCLVACDDDDDDDDDAATSDGTSDGDDSTSSSDYDYAYSADNADSWMNYAINTAKLLSSDATELYDSWNSSYDGGDAFATTFKSHSGGDYTSALSCVEQIIDGCIDIASEVGEAKIGDPLSLYQAGSTTEALYAVESWFSWHSRDDYSNNIISIQNSYYGSYNDGLAANVDNGVIADNSIAALIKANNAELHNTVDAAITAAWDAIQAIPQPFRSNIYCDESVAAQEACADLVSALESLKAYIQDTDAINDDTTLDPIIENYITVVVLPTYSKLATLNESLLTAVNTLNSNRTNANFSAACDAWLASREPWEKSEAFLFGPVDGLGLDPNMDSWPLDIEAIIQVLKSESWSSMEWSEDDADDAIEAAQSVRGFHTLEFLLFYDGDPRTVD